MSPLITMALGKVIDVVSKRAAARGRIKEAKEEVALEAIRNRQKDVGYMDDFLLFIHAGPVIGVFFPWTRPETMQGIEALSALPDWYLVVWFSMISAVWGIPKIADLRVRK